MPEPEIDTHALTQIRNIATLDPAVRVAVMPDAHKGYEMPIGSMLEVQGVVLVCPPDADVLDEAARAHKDIEEVMSLQSDLVDPVTKLLPLGVVKG